MSQTTVINDYKTNKSLKSAARKAGISEIKARKILITAGYLHYDRTDKLLKLIKKVTQLNKQQSN